MIFVCLFPILLADYKRKEFSFCLNTRETNVPGDARNKNFLAGACNRCHYHERTFSMKKTRKEKKIEQNKK